MKTKAIISGLAIVLFSAFFGTAQTQQSKTITPEDLWNLSRVGAPIVAPDGKTAIFVMTSFDIDKNTSSSNLHLLNIENGQQRQLTFSGKDASPVWSPDGKTIAFVSRRDGNAQLYLMPIDGGEAQKITNLPVGIFAPKWFPDGKSMAFAANVYPDFNGDFAVLEKLIKEKKDSKVTAKVTENRMYRYWDRWLTDEMYPTLFKIDLASKNITNLLPESRRFFNIGGGASYDIAPDGREIAISMNASLPPYNDINNDIFLLKTDGSGQLRNITVSNPASDNGPLYSPDGNFILYGRQNRPDFYADNVQMVVYDRRSDSHRNITQTIDLSCEQWIWSEDGKTIFFHAEHKAMKSLFSIPASGGRHTLILFNGTNDNVALAGRNHLVFTQHSIDKPSDIYRIARTGKDLSQLTKANEPIMNALKLGKVENVTYKGANEADVQMFVVYPPDYDASKKYPLVLMIHGGPHGTFGDAWHYRWNAHLFAAPGYIAAMPNFHGSTSFGQDFAISIHGQHAEKPYQDIMKATDYLIEKGIVDPTAMAATGGSYGGYMVSWIAGNTDRYAALVNHAGVYDLMTQFGSDVTSYREIAYGGTPWENIENLQKNNPAMNAHNFKTPMLVMHGELDYRVPVAQAFIVYGIYKAKDLDARLVYFPDENHWILSPQNSIFWYQELYDWLGRYLKK